MERNFFGTSGLTNTSANHVANLAKEYYEKLQKELEDYKYENIDVSFLDGNVSKRIQEGVDIASFLGMPNKIRKIAECRALVSYLREAIKESQYLFSSLADRIHEEFPMPEPPERIFSVTKEEIMATWSIGKLNKYYALEAKCVTLGKIIHPDGDFSKKRKQSSDKVRTTVQNNTNNVLVYTYTPSVPSANIDEMFFALQNEYRSAQAELNGIKQEIDDAIQKDSVAKMAKWDEEMTAYRVECQKITAKENQRRIQENERLQSLKIVIPDNLKDIYNEIKNLSK